MSTNMSTLWNNNPTSTKSTVVLLPTALTPISRSKTLGPSTARQSESTMIRHRIKPA